MASTLRELHDHCTLSEASSTVRFRSTGTTARVYPMIDNQFIIEDDVDADGTHRVLAKKVVDASSGLKFLRASYTLVTTFFVGFLLVFCIQILLYVMLDLTIELGVTHNSEDTHTISAIGIFLSLPMFIVGFSSALVIGNAYVIDTWEGHPLVKRFVFGRLGGVVTEWVGFLTFVGVPVFAIGVTSIMAIKNWWEIASFIWFCCIGFFYLAFACCVVWYENRAAWALIKNRYQDDDDSPLHVLFRCFMLRQRSVYSGVITSAYMAQGAFDAGRDEDVKMQEGTRTILKTMYGRLAAWKVLSTEENGFGLFEHLGEERKKRQYTVDEALDVRAYLTSDTWSLERVFCRPTDSRYIALLNGPEALTRAQMWSSVVCDVLGKLFVLFVAAGFLTWLGAPAGVTFIMILLIIAVGMLPSIQHSLRIFKMVQGLLWTQNTSEETSYGSEEGAVGEDTSLISKRRSTRRAVDADSVGIYEISETYRCYEATDRMCYLMFGIEFFFLFFWPFISLLKVGSPSFAFIFFFIVIFTALRAYLNSAIVLEEVGNFDLVDGEKDSREKWFNQSRLATITHDVSRSRAKGLWMGVLGFFLFCFVFLFLVAVAQQGDTTSNFQFTYMPDFYYEQQEDLQYPTCSIGKGLVAVGGKKTDVSDFVYVAGLAYNDPSVTQSELDQWFGEGVAVDNEDFVQEYREANNVQSAVSFKLITFPDSGLALLAIRGTSNAWDALSDAQLWSAAMVFQALRFMLPMSEIWTPMMHRLINIISWAASETINKVAFYRETTAFAKHLLSMKEEGTFSNVQVTGHSLGGGLSIITGAQAGIPAVAVSGPNAMLSRDTFDPPVTIDALNSKTFNIIPDRDFVPRFDDTAALFQKVRCTTEPSDFAGCHSSGRTLCEILHTCGTGNRPALCDCTCEFGYPEPKAKEGVTSTFAEICKDVPTCAGYFGKDG